MEHMMGDVVAVVGMGRSGTSTIARGLLAIGVDLGTNLMAADPQVNPLGFWEDNDLHALCEKLLVHLKMRGDSVRTVRAAEWASPEVLELKTRAVTLVKERVTASRGNIWGCKNPRMALLMPFWLDVFAEANCRDRYVVAIRNPLSVANSIRRLGDADPRKTYAVWMAHNMGAMQAVMRGKSCVVVDYDLLMAEPRQQLQRMASRLGLAATTHRDADIDLYSKEFLRGDHRHSTHTIADMNRDEMLPRSIAQAYELLYEAAQDRISTADTAFAGQWHQVVSALGDAWSLLSYFEVAEEAARVARKHRGIWPFRRRTRAPKTE